MKMYLMLLTLLAVLVVPTIAGIPAVLPDPDTTPPDTTLPVKVFILSGQSNMVGMGRVAGSEAGTLETITKTDGLFPHLIDDAGNWTVRNDVRYRGTVTATGDGLLIPGFGAVNGISNNFGPELGFGHVMGYYYDEPVLVIKSSQGNRSISWDFAPPSTTRFDYDGRTYAGYGDTPNSWPIGGSADPVNWYAGKQYDDCFMDEADWHPMATTLGFGSITNVTDVLDNFATQYPQYAAQGFEIAGYGWWQGHKDGGEQGTVEAGIHATRYELNMVNFINDIREYYQTRYPDNIKSDAPFVVATVGFGGGEWDTGSSADVIHTAQMAVGDPDKHPEFAGNVGSVDTTGYWRDGSISPTSTGYHYNHNAETFMLVGDAMGRAMADLQRAFDVDAGKNMVTWSNEIVTLDATVEEGVTVDSYLWTAIPADGVLFSNPTGEDTTVTITKDAGDMAAVMVRLAVDNGVDDPVVDSVRIEVYDNACLATRDGLGIKNEYDLSGNCIVDIGDVVIMATMWLEDNSLTEPAIKTNN